MAGACLSESEVVLVPATDCAWFGGGFPAPAQVEKPTKKRRRLAQRRPPSRPLPARGVFVTHEQERPGCAKNQRKIDVGVWKLRACAP